MLLDILFAAMNEGTQAARHNPFEMLVTSDFARFPLYLILFLGLTGIVLSVLSLFSVRNDVLNRIRKICLIAASVLAVLVIRLAARANL